MSIGFTIRGAAATVIAFIAVSGRAAAQSPCRTPDWLGTRIVEQLTTFVTATSADYAIVRDSLRLPAAAANEVEVVGTDSLCAVAAAAYAADRRGVGAGLSGRVLVVKIKTAYVVFDPEFDNYPVAGQPKATVRIVFNSSWQPLARY